MNMGNRTEHTQFFGLLTPAAWNCSMETMGQTGAGLLTVQLADC